MIALAALPARRDDPFVPRVSKPRGFLAIITWTPSSCQGRLPPRGCI